jgi:RNA polymerase sigma factor (sigma-70 family)
MATKSFNGVVQQLRKIAAVQTSRACPDHDLLERFVQQHDDAAFTVLVERHGPMVLGVCRRALGQRDDAEDVCQATFLVLARKAASIRKSTSLSSWLRKVACCAAANLHRERARRRRRERAAPAPPPRDPGAEVSWREVQTVLDEELQRLPERYRTPLILCYLDGQTRDEAARQLGLSAGRLHGQLERGRQLLRQRLAQRGLTLSATLFAAALGDTSARAALSPTMVVSSTRAAMLLAAGQPLPESTIAGPVRILNEEVLKDMFLTKLKLGAAMALCAGAVVALSAGLFAATGRAQDPNQPAPKWNQTQLSAKSESDEEFIRRVSRDLRGTEPTPAEIHFFLASKDAGKRQKLIDLFIQERQARQKADPEVDADGGTVQILLKLKKDRDFERSALWLLSHSLSSLDTLQKQFYEDLQSARDRADVARATQEYLDGLSQYVKDRPKHEDAAQAMLQIIRVYEAQGKNVEAGAWRDKLLKEHPQSAAAKAVK